MFAAPPSMAKLVWSDGHAITTSSGQGKLSYDRKNSELYLFYSNYNIVRSQKMRLSDKDGKLSQSSFVAEWLTGPGLHPVGKTEPFCKSASSSELRPLILACNGLIRLRELNAEEKSEMDAFKSEVQGWFNGSLRSTHTDPSWFSMKQIYWMPIFFFRNSPKLQHPLR